MSGAEVAALARATTFLRAQSQAPWLDEPWCDRLRPVRARVVGNWIGELDRLLRVLLDACAPTPYRRTAARLEALGASDSVARLTGLARAHVTFRYTGGAARRADTRGGSHMTVGWSGPDGALRRFRIGERVHLGSAGLIEICDLYDELAAHVVRAGRERERGMKEYERFEAIAAQHRRDAEAATLDNVRERCRRSEDAWTKMAAQSRRTELRREERARLTTMVQA